MRALRAEDPREVGGHRLLARLGAGGMGVVYLARTGGGALVALKVIRAGQTADPGFRARFRREAEVAEGLNSPWLVPVTGADADAAEPWLATPFVPGPSLAEAVAAYGPLPERTVRVLGARLADALAEVHGAGLIHRDVKPGNVLLAMDGPRLIDFGIARPVGPSALTRDGAIVGTPGYVPPEQADHKGAEAVPAGDVFALGCVLAYAASGRRPFGGGDPFAVFYRTVHEEPDVEAVPDGIREPALRCLAKAPGDRPTAAEVRDTLTAPGTPGTPGTGDGDWLPAAVLRLVAERSSAALDPPPPEEPEPTRADDPPPPSRRGLLLAGGAAAVTLATGGGVTAYVASRRARTTPPDAAPLPVHTLGVLADLSGPGRAAGRAVERGARLAVAAHNSRTEKKYRLALRVSDDGGDPARAERTARALLADGAVRAVIGPTAEAAAEAVAELFEKARTAMVLVNVSTGLKLSTSEHRTLCVTRAPETVLQAPLTGYLTRTVRSTRTAVIDDRAAGKAGWAWASGLREYPPNEGTVTVHPVEATDADFAPAVRDALATRPQAVVHTGVSPARAAACARALAAQGFTGARAGVWHIMTPDFLTGAGAAAEGWVFSAPYIDPSAPPLRTFAAAHRTRYGTAPARWSAEAYDAVGLVATTLDALSDTATPSTAAVARRVFTTTHQGLAKPLAFAQDVTHALRNEDGTLFLYEVRDGAFRYLGPFE
ncbi:bifunctional serine/threonine-protein kinase/ABC transporter substrate-binding protein [Streptomyces sp. TRM49041]|uniref:bifunctional serine/threonine-protein kinase/ABC transporter substrate-binding protein n=1 Tax=Streptomyces sp. TRM49041 TaxID=2603216 RepID=UPI0011EE60C3|nr:bifunctional serine/threonine-protein kinase/ABC transporter substrate-binding protein [Streptomyces sp. TRM49041]